MSLLGIRCLQRQGTIGKQAVQTLALVLCHTLFWGGMPTLAWACCGDQDHHTVSIRVATPKPTRCISVLQSVGIPPPNGHNRCAHPVGFWGSSLIVQMGVPGRMRYHTIPGWIRCLCRIGSRLTKGLERVLEKVPHTAPQESVLVLYYTLNDGLHGPARAGRLRHAHASVGLPPIISRVEQH